MYLTREAEILKWRRLSAEDKTAFLAICTSPMYAKSECKKKLLH